MNDSHAFDLASLSSIELGLEVCTTSTTTQQIVFQHHQQRINFGQTQHPDSILAHSSSQRVSLFSIPITTRASEEMCRVQPCCILQQGLPRIRLANPAQEGLQDPEEDQ
jgi:hypothetical protein